MDQHELFLFNKAVRSLEENEKKKLYRIEKLDVTKYSEADVREEIINTVLDILGYRKDNNFSLDREKNIKFIGKEKKKNGTDKRIDYVIKLWKKDFWIVEAKKPMPQSSNFGYDTFCQAFEYACHPEINAALIVLCDGIKLEIFDRDINVVEPILQLKINTISQNFEKIQKILDPLNVWFFYRRRILREIDRAFEGEINSRRVDEFEKKICDKLDEVRSQARVNYRQQIILNPLPSFTKRDFKDIIEFDFYMQQSQHTSTMMIEQLVNDCREYPINTFIPVICYIFPEEVKYFNDLYCAHALAFLMKLDQENCNVNLFPSWLTKSSQSGTKLEAAIELLIQYCLNYFKDDEPRKIILQASNSYRRLIKSMHLHCYPITHKIGEMEHLLTRYFIPENTFRQLYSSPESSAIMTWDKMTHMAMHKLIRDYKDERNQFKINQAKKFLEGMWQHEVTLRSSIQNYDKLLKETGLDELVSTEANGIVYDQLADLSLFYINQYPKWKNYVIDKHKNELEILANNGISIAGKILWGGKAPTQFSKEYLSEKFFFGKIDLLEKLMNAYQIKLPQKDTT